MHWDPSKIRVAIERMKSLDHPRGFGIANELAQGYSEGALEKPAPPPNNRKCAECAAPMYASQRVQVGPHSLCFGCHLKYKRGMFGEKYNS